MKKLKIAFQGEMGAYSHLACEELFPGSEIKACPTFEETFKIAHDNEDYKIIIPIENSSAGSVANSSSATNLSTSALAKISSIESKSSSAMRRRLLHLPLKGVAS